MKNDPNKDGDEWLQELADQAIVEDHLGRKIVLTDVVDHLVMKPYEALPPDLIDVLDRWLRATSNCRIQNAKAGRTEAVWYPIVDRLIANGLSVKEACEAVHKDDLYKHLDFEHMMDMYKRHNRKRSSARKRLHTIVDALFNTKKKKRPPST